MLTIKIIEAAAETLRPVATRTPLLRSAALDEVTGGRIFLKCENLQQTGSFKFRGAYNKLAQIQGPTVIAFSSGNHAQGVARAAQLLGKKAIILMPADAPQIKIDNCRAMGAELRLIDRYRDDREALATELASETGGTLVKPFDDHAIMAGQGTAGLEMAEDLLSMGLTPDCALICTGGGGLMAGCATALHHHFPAIALHTVEPKTFNDWQRSLAQGKILPNENSEPSICDALLSRQPGDLTFAVLNPLLKQGLTVSDDEVREAIRFATRNLKLVVEPGGAVALAAALHRKIDLKNKTALVMISGGNIDPALLAEIIGQ